ncbi:hypothetical protein AMECASPLE_031600 [Ameca splendens]|uniref:Uncharacterized protein n=1 Tax=Ameca splendens TaxID=208324 RepID=A0ABV1ADW9_9TELE
MRTPLKRKSNHRNCSSLAGLQQRDFPFNSSLPELLLPRSALLGVIKALEMSEWNNDPFLYPIPFQTGGLEITRKCGHCLAEVICYMETCAADHVHHREADSKLKQSSPTPHTSHQPWMPLQSAGNQSAVRYGPPSWL